MLSVSQPEGGIGLIGVALAFGLALLTVSCALGPVSGAHFNPAVTLGFAVAGRIGWDEVLPYVMAQLTGAVFATCSLAFIASGPGGFNADISALAANGYGLHSPAGFGARNCFLTEFLLTFVFVAIMLGGAREACRLPQRAFVSGLALILIHLISLPITNTSINPARSTGPAVVLYALRQEWVMDQLWMFWVAPLMGGALAGYLVPWMFRDEQRKAAPCWSAACPREAGLAKQQLESPPRGF